MRKQKRPLVNSVASVAIALCALSTGRVAQAQGAPTAPPLECYFFRQSKAPTGSFIDLLNAKPGTLYGLATVDTRNIVRGDLYEGKSGGAFKGKFLTQPAKLDLTGNGLAFGAQDDLKIFNLSGSARVRVKSLPNSPVPMRETQASRFIYAGYVAYCVDTDSIPDASAGDDVTPVSCVFYAKPDGSGHFFGALDGNMAGRLAGQVCLSSAGCLRYGFDRQVDMAAQSFSIPLPDGSGSLRYDFRESIPGPSGSVAKEVRFYRSMNAAPLPDHISCTIWANDAVFSEPGGGSGNSDGGQYNPPPVMGGGGLQPPPSNGKVPLPLPPSPGRSAGGKGGFGPDR